MECDLASVKEKMLFKAVNKGGQFIDCFVCKVSGRTEPMVCCGVDILISWKGRGENATKYSVPLLRIICPVCACETSMVYSPSTVALQASLGSVEAIFAKRPAWLIPTFQQQIDGIPRRLPVPEGSGGQLADIARRIGIIRSDGVVEDDPFADVDVTQPAQNAQEDFDPFAAWWAD